MPFILKQFIDILKQFIFQLLIYKNSLYFYKPLDQENNYFSSYNPIETVYSTQDRELDLDNPLNKNFILLNNISYQNSEILKPYCDIISCEEALNDENSIWLYFLILLISLNFIHSMYILSLLSILDSFNQSLFINIAIFLPILTVSFLYMLFLYIKNIHLNICNKFNIFKALQNDNSSLKNLEDIDTDFFILKNRTYFSQSEALNNIENIEKNILDKLKNIFQMAVPIFYLAHITIAMAYLTKDN